MDCGVALREAADNLEDVLAALHGGGQVKPPSGQWTWEDCATDTPAYTDEGLACLDITALRCAHALFRRGSIQVPGPWGEGLKSVTALFAADEARAAALLSTEAQVDAAFAYKDAVAEPVSDVLVRELGLLAADRERLAAALAPTLAPAFSTGLAWTENSNPGTVPASAQLAPLQLAPNFARTTAQWARLAHRAGQNPDDVRAAVRLAAISIHAASAELHARLHDDPAAAPGLHALGPALQLLATVHDELTAGATSFGYAAAYVPLALGPQDIALHRSNFEAVQALAADEITQFAQVAADAWQKVRDYEQKIHTVAATAFQIEAEYDGKLRALCGSLPGETKPALATCGVNGGQIAELRATVEAAGLRIRHAGRAIQTTRRFAAHEGELTLSSATEYDAQDRILREHYPDGSLIEREYTARGLEAPLAGWMNATTWDARGRWTDISLNSDLHLTRALNHSGRLHAQQVRRGDASLLDLAHNYDVAGLLTETRDLVGPTPHTPALEQRFTHDDLHRLTQASGPYGAQSFTYSDDENLLTLAGTALTYDGAQPHAVAHARGQSFTYDAAGQLARVTGDGPVTPGAWQFDPHCRLQSFSTEDGHRTEHIYDHAGKETVRREFNPAGQLAHETLYFSPAAEVRDGQLVRWIFWSGERIAESPTEVPRGDEPLPAAAMITGLLLLLLLRRLQTACAHLRHRLGIFARPLRHAPALAVLGLAILSCGDHRTGTLRPDAQTRFHITDRLGSAALVLDHDGEVIARDLHEPYGAPVISWRAEHQPGPTYRFTGKEDHTLAGAVSIGARQYLPALGRWASPDPQFLLDPEAQLDRPGERNLYRYAGNGPVQHIDPSGYGWFSAAIKLAKAAVKSIVRGADKVDEFNGIIDDAATIVSSDAGIGSRVLSALSLASEFLPLSAGDVMDGYRWVRGGDRVLDASASARSAQNTAAELSSNSAPAARTSTLHPGPYAGESIPARGPGRDFTKDEHAQGNALGQAQGCHTCGTRNPGTKSGNYVLDHQPPSALNPPGNEQRLHPQCLNCSQRQGGQVRVAKASGNGP